MRLPALPPATSGVAVPFYLQRLDEDVLESLRAYAHEFIHPTARTFSIWLVDQIDEEEMRRLDINRGDVREADLPRIPIHKWTNTEVADALEAITFASFTIQHAPMAELLERLVMTITAAASHRLRKAQ